MSLGQTAIRTTWLQRWRLFRYQLLPLVLVSACAVLTAWLWTRHAGSLTGVGEVWAQRLEVASRVDGMLAPLPYRQMRLFETVVEGEIIARLDDRELLAQLRVVQAELSKANRDMEMTIETVRLAQEDRKQRDLSETRRLAVWLMESRLSVLDRKTQLTTDRVDLQRLSETYSVLKDVYARRAINRLDIINAEFQKSLTEKRIERNEIGLAQAEAQVKLALDRIEKQRAIAPTLMADVEKLLAPVEASVSLQQSRLAEIELKIDNLQIRAPRSGAVAAVYRQPGQVVRAGEPIVAIAAAESEYIVSYVRQTRNVVPMAGMQVDIRRRTIPTQTIVGFVEHVGPQVEAVPPHQLRDPKVPEWGLPVRIAVPPSLKLLPGELVSLRLRKDSANNPPVAPTAAKPLGDKQT